MDDQCRLVSRDDTRVVLYSSAHSMWATRVWWMLHSFGLDNAAILDGGWSKWVAEGRPVSTDACAYPPDQFTARPRAGKFIGKEEVLAAVGAPGVCLINALAPDVYAGTSEYMYGRKGHIPGSVNVPYASVHDADTGAYLPADRLREIFDAVHTGDADRVILYCGGGIGSTNDAFALTLLGYENVAVYDASMFEWGNDASLPMEVG